MIIVEVIIRRDGQKTPMLVMKGNALGRMRWDAPTAESEIVDISEGVTNVLHRFDYIPNSDLPLL